MRRLRHDDGANAVEFVLVFPILIMLLFGLITGGLALNEQQQISHAAREASRFGATFAEPAFSAFPPNAGAFDAVASRASTTSSGIRGRDQALVCVSFWAGPDSGSPVRRWYRLDNATSTAAPPGNQADTCPDLVGNSGAEAWVHVTIRMPARLEAILFSRDLTLTAHAVSIYEVQ